MSSIGIFGGSFNPIHKGHVALARQLLRRAQLDEVWFLVSPQNPLKPQSLLLDDNMRLEMARLALKDEPHLVASDYEFHLPRPSYTWNTLQHLSQDYPQHRFTLIIGADNWQLFSRWRNSRDILANYSVVIYPRDGYPVDETTLPPNVRLVKTRLYNMSSTLVRQLLAERKSMRRYLHPKVIDFIKENQESNRMYMNIP
ncbi:MAG: nicotinate-nucleotide adenylyltransferase [Prevotella sp.]|nr:nicotinate-nucleotide adenylyltransferase [Prevotella sp.]